MVSVYLYRADALWNAIDSALQYEQIPGWLVHRANVIHDDPRLSCIDKLNCLYTAVSQWKPCGSTSDVKNLLHWYMYQLDDALQRIEQERSVLLEYE